MKWIVEGRVGKRKQAFLCHENMRILNTLTFDKTLVSYDKHKTVPINSNFLDKQTKTDLFCLLIKLDFLEVCFIADYPD